MKQLFYSILIIISMSFYNCSSDTTIDDNEKSLSPAANLDANVAPIKEGSWYKAVAWGSWQWQLTGEINTSYDVTIYDIDLFETSIEQIAELQNLGRKVICYFSAGSYENWRTDKNDFLKTDLGETMDGWEDEKWLDIRSKNVTEIMKKRLDLAKEKGCDGVEPDNMDGYTNDTGFDLTANDQKAYNRFIGNEAHKRNLSVGLKNDGDQISDLVDYYDFSVNEQCHQYDECESYLKFVANNKPVFNAEYASKLYDENKALTSKGQTLCTTAKSENIRTLILPLDLDDSFRISCDEQ